ncbi:TIGR03915 family putative DNA repair protein [Serpentinicella sp. ANB-PHB4]|uniref:TIGR03915 family putative DNA repair protein n=1 Tax=Serpentinicella sp. ANB-PHB4 TaxID=3074076 RepID=UPI002863C98F|nr:TIGR03915 family putative DNA repair protein [Serpentinicella sp. ANB-PHB4]MDR5658821.1 TIGR03915 family putative DNA repair protein [Serpentinicella sp. ANB-PHB4]
MLIYIYDGSFDGLLTLTYDSYYNKEVPDKIMQEASQEDFLANYTVIKTDEKKAQKVYEAIRDKFSKDALNHIYYAFLSEQLNREKFILNYIKLGFKTGKDIDRMLSNDTVLFIHNLSKKVSRERHRMLGLTRFIELDKGILYAKIQPKYNVLSLLAPHFSKRLSGERWVIHDVDRAVAVIYSNSEWYTSEFKVEKDVPLSDQEVLFQSLWKNYFDSISIKEKQNLKLQQKNMPKRYWGNLVEKN